MIHFRHLVDRAASISFESHQKFCYARLAVTAYLASQAAEHGYPKCSPEHEYDTA
jgi:hypothetical protein